MSKFSEEKHLIARQQLGLFFAERRKQMGHSVEALAEFIGMAPYTLKKIEAGEINFKLSLLFVICEALEIKPFFVPLEEAGQFEEEKQEVKMPNLEDAWLLSVVHKNTFELPINEDILSLKSGDLIKVCATGERFWCKIIDVLDDGFIAEIDNNLVNTDKHGLRSGDLIFIEPKNIYQIWHEKTD